MIEKAMEEKQTDSLNPRNSTVKSAVRMSMYTIDEEELSDEDLLLKSLWIVINHKLDIISH